MRILRGSKKRFLPVWMIVLALCLSGCGASSETTEAVSPDVLGEPLEGWEAPETEEAGDMTEPAEEEPGFEEYDISIMAVGDNLMHMGLIYTGQQADGTYDYSILFEGITDFLEAADMRIINQETILGGNEKGFSGYPTFNTPTEVGDAIVQAGFNVVLHATNHTADMGVAGMDSCVAYWKQHPEVMMLGLHEPDSEAGIPLMTIGDVTFAILNYTYGPNYGTVPRDIAARMDVMCAVDESSRALDYGTMDTRVLEDIRMADGLADFVIVCPHWGTENSTEPSGAQERFALQMVEAGADLIFGTHPHVLQPVEWITAENGNRALCYYSLGNYVSTMKAARNMLEGMAWVTFHVTEEGAEISEEKTGLLPLVCHYTSGPVRFQRVYLLEEYSSELAAGHGIIEYGGVSFSYDKLCEWEQEVIGEDWTLTREDILPAEPLKTAGQY